MYEQIEWFGSLIRELSGRQILPPIETLRIRYENLFQNPEIQKVIYCQCHNNKLDNANFFAYYPQV
jgi:hypothetical protein